MTIGFGDFVPGNSYIYNKTETMSEVRYCRNEHKYILCIHLYKRNIKVEGNLKLVLGSIYLLLGLAIIAMVFNLMGEKLFTQV